MDQQTTPAAKTHAVAERFLKRLSDLGRGELAVLRRNAGSTLGESRDALGIFYRILPAPLLGGWDEEVYFLVATLFALNDGVHAGDFGTTMRSVRSERGAGTPGEQTESPVDRRMRILLDSGFNRIEGRAGGGELAYRLRQCVRLALSADVGVDWPLLLRDLSQWGWANRPVQKRWARSYYGEAQPTTATPEGGAEDAR